MAQPSLQTPWPNFRFNLQELAGAVGDYGTLFPLVLGVAVVCPVNLGHILLFVSLCYIVTGIYYRAPMPVQPMKAIAAIAIAEKISAGEIAASGILLGIFFLLLGAGRVINFVHKYIPLSVIRGIQFGLALVLFKTSYKFIRMDYRLSAICIFLVVLFLFLNRLFRVTDLSPILLLLLGIFLGLMKSGPPPVRFLDWPTLIIPTPSDFLRGGWHLVIPQIPLTITNAILATTLLMQDLLQKNISPRKLSLSIGLMNLTSVPFGGFPLCHGAGGLAAQYRFGARTGGANVITGLILLPIALVFAGPEWIALIPPPIYGAMLVFAALELVKHLRNTDSYPITALVGILALLINIAVAFLAGLLLYLLMRKFLRKTSHDGRS